MKGFFLALLVCMNVTALEFDVFLKTIKPGDKVAIYVGTFDPLHIRHDEIMRQALETGAIDYVLAIPNDLAVHKANATDVNARLEMLQMLYKNDPKIIVPHNYDEIIFPMVRSLPKELFKIVGRENMFALMGEDSVRRKSVQLVSLIYKDLIGNWLVSYPETPKTPIPNELVGLPVISFYAPASEETDDIHSSAIRKYFLEHKNDDARPVGKDLKLQQPVADYIKDHHLFESDGKGRRNKLKAYTKVCIRLILKMGQSARLKLKKMTK